jgi:hypothetical protein
VASELNHTTTTTTTGPVSISFGASPLGGMNGTAELVTATSATVRLQFRVNASAGWVSSQSIVLDPGTQPIANIPVYPPYTDARWDVVAIAGGSIRLSAVGIGA